MEVLYVVHVLFKNSSNFKLEEHSNKKITCGNLVLTRLIVMSPLRKSTVTKFNCMINSGEVSLHKKAFQVKKVLRC